VGFHVGGISLLKPPLTQHQPLLDVEHQTCYQDL